MAAEAAERGAAESAGEMTGGAAECVPTSSATSCGGLLPDEMAPVRSAYRDCLLRRELKALANPGQPAAEAVGEMTGGGGSDDGGGVGSDGAAAPLPSPLTGSGATPGSGAVGSDAGEAGERAGTSEAMCDDDEGGGGGDGKRQRGERGGKSGDVRRREAAKGRQRFLEEQRRM